MAYGKAEEIIVVRKWKVEKYMEQIYVQTEDLSVGYHKKVLLSDIALKVNKGEIHCIKSDLMVQENLQ